MTKKSEAQFDEMAVKLALAATLGTALLELAYDRAAYAVGLLGLVSVLTLSRAWQRPSLQRRPVRVCLLITWLVVVATSAAFWPGARIAPALILLPVFGSVGTLLCGFQLGNLGFVVSLALLLVYCWLHPTHQPVEVAIRANMAVALVTNQWFVFHYGRTFQAARRRLAEQQLRIGQHLEERARLTRALGDDLSETVEELANELTSPQPELTRLREIQNGLEDALARARLVLEPHKQSVAPVTSASPMADFSLRMTRWLLSISTASVALLCLRVVLLGQGPVRENMIALAGNVALLVVLLRKPQHRAQIVAMLTGGGLAAIVSLMWFWGREEPGPGLIFLPTVGYNAVLIGGARVGLGLALMNLSILAYAALAGAASNVWGQLVLLHLALLTVVMQICWYLLEGQVGRRLLVLHERALDLGRLHALRTRICGTLFHDVANPVLAIGMIFELGARVGGISEANEELARRLQKRLAGLVDATLAKLQSDGSVRPEHVMRASLLPIFEELRELFALRLADKSQTLLIRCTPELSVMCATELLRDSVLANLVSNALKFSPARATIELAAEAEGDEVQIAVRDQGPGWPDELPQRLASGERSVSVPGTAGEQGLGLGLTLATEHLRQMGGTLQLRARTTVGAEALVRLVAS